MRFVRSLFLIRVTFQTIRSSHSEGKMKFYIQVNDGEPVAFASREAFEETLTQLSGKGWVREWQDAGDGRRRMHKRVWR